MDFWNYSSHHLNMTQDQRDRIHNSQIIDNSVKYLHDYAFVAQIQLYVIVPLAILTCLSNALVVYVFLRRSMRSVASVVMVAIAVADSLTCVALLVDNFAVYGNEHEYSGKENGMVLYKYKISDTICHAHFKLILFFIGSFHACSIWLTAVLAIQRYCIIRNCIVTVKNTTCLCAFIFAVVPVLNVYVLIRDINDGKTCFWSEMSKDICYSCIYRWIWLILCFVVPVMILAGFTILFIKLLKTNTAVLRNHGNNLAARRQRQTRQVTQMVTVIVVVLLIAESPLIVGVVDIIISDTYDRDSDFTFDICINISQILTGISTHANFWIYMCLYKRFRNELLTSAVRPLGNALRASLEALVHLRSGQAAFSSEREPNETRTEGV